MFPGHDTDSFRVLEDCARMSANIYSVNHLQGLKSWQIPEGGLYENAENGLKFACYLHDDYRDGFRRAVIVFRGTNNFANLKTDLELLFAKIPSNFYIAASAVNRMIRDCVPAGYRLIFTGHSLGAVYATIFAHLMKTAAICFDSPGVKPLVESERSLSIAASDPQVKVLNYLSSPHVINTLHPHCGEAFRLYIGHRDFEISHNQIARSAVGSAKQLLNLAATVSPALGEAAFAARGATAAVGGAGATLAIARGLSTGLSAIRSWFSASPTASKVVSHTVDAVDYLTWLLRQHRMENVYNELVGPTARLKLAKVSVWPKLTLAFPAVLSGGAIKSEVPFHPDSEGIHTLFDEQRFLEERLTKYYGENYRVTSFEGDEAVTMQRSYFNKLGRELSHEEIAIPASELLEIDNPLMQALTRYALDSCGRVSTALAEPSSLIMYPSGHLDAAIVPVSPEVVRENSVRTQTALALSFAGAIIVRPADRAYQRGGSGGAASCPVAGNN